MHLLLGNDYGYGGTHQIHHFIETHGGHDDSNAEDHSDEQEDHGSYKKDLALHEIFDIALTTLAFLSFGCFMLQVVMCITSVIIIMIKCDKCNSIYDVKHFFSLTL